MMNAGLEYHKSIVRNVRAALAARGLERPILIKGEPGTGKTQLAMEVARALERPLYEWHIKSTTKAQQPRAPRFVCTT